MKGRSPMSFAAASTSSCSTLRDSAGTAVIETTYTAPSDLGSTLHETQKEPGAADEATLRSLFLSPLPLPLRDSTTPSEGGGLRRSQDLSRQSLATVAAVALSPGMLPTSASHSLVSATPTPPPLLVRPSKKALKGNRNGCAANVVGGGASLFRDWSTNAALLDRVLDTPFFDLLPEGTENTAETESPSAAAAAAISTTAAAHPVVPSLEPSPSNATFTTASAPGGAAPKATAGPLSSKSLNRAGSLTTTDAQRQTETMASAHDPACHAATLPTSDAPVPSILLIALADMDVLQQSLYAHTLVTPVKDQLAEFKRLVAASMRSELKHERQRPHAEDFAAEAQPAGAVAGDAHADHDAASGGGEKVTGAVQCSNDLPGDSAPIDSSVRAHDAAARAALRAAHGFLYGNETVPIGVPAVHLQRARREWALRYRVVHVQPRLQKTQRRRYEAWAQQLQSLSGGGTGGDTLQHSAPASQRAMTAVSLCAALQPAYWRRVSVMRPSCVSAAQTAAHPATADTPPAQVNGAAGSHAFIPPPARRPLSLSLAHCASPLHSPSSAKAATGPVLYTAAWDVDLYDDLGLAVAAEQCEMMAHQATSRTVVEAMELDKTGSEGLASPPLLLSTPAAYASTMVLSAPSLLLDRAGDLTQMQLTLPVFVYVVSRYLFVAHYAAYFPAGLFSRALIDPFYFPDAVQCTPEYALRAAPALRREAQRLYVDYAAQLADAHRCFPDRACSTEVPLSPTDMFHLWELLCPPQRQDVSGRWSPIPWGHLMPEEEEALLEEDFKSVAEAGPCSGDKRALCEESLLRYPYARAARQTYRRRLQKLAQHPALLTEVHRLLCQCEDVALRFFTMMDMEQKGYITWEAFTNALIEEADVQDHHRKVRERAANLTRTSASVFDRYVVEPLAPTLVRLGYTGKVFEVRHSASLVMLEGATDYAVCDGTQLGSIHQRFLVRPIEVLCKELEGESRDAFGRLIRGSSGDLGGGGGDKRNDMRDASSATGATGYDEELRLRPWRNNQRPALVYVRYEDGRRLQDSTALNLLQKLSSSSATGARAAAGEEGDAGEEGGEFADARAHQPAKAVSLEGILAVEDVSPCVPWPVFVAHGNDMLLRLYSTNRAIQALPEAGVVRCTEAVASMEWAAGGRRERIFSDSRTATSRSSVGARSAGVDGAGSEERAGQGRRSAAPSDRTPFSAGASPPPPHRRSHRCRISVQRQEYLLLGTRKGTIILVDLYALLNRVPRLATLAGVHGGGAVGEASGSAAGDGMDELGDNSEVANAMRATTGITQPVSERIGDSESAWSGYHVLAQRTYYGDIGPFVADTRQVHTPDTLVSSVVAAATSGLVVSSGLDGDVFTMRLAYPSAWITGTGTPRTPCGGATGIGSAIAEMRRPLVRIEVLHRMRVCDSGVRYALPIPFLSMLAVQTATNKVYLYHTSVLPTAPALADGGRGDAASAQVSPASSSAPKAASEVAEVAADRGVALATAATLAMPPRLELYDPAAPHLGSIVAMMLVKELDQLITVDSSSYVKVWSLRQTQPLTSFYAWAPLSVLNSGNGVGDAGRSAGWASRGDAAAHRGSGFVAGASAYGVPTAPSALLRTTKSSIEAAVEAAEYRLQPCRSAAYNYAGRQLFVMGSHNAAHCFFVSGQSSARAHTEPLRVLLVDTTTVLRVGRVHHRLISLSSADCRVWSLLTGAMELGIRANSAEYRHLWDHRLTNNVRGKSSSAAKSSGQQRLEAKGGRGGSRRAARPWSTYSVRMYSASSTVALTAASSSATTTGERQRLLPPSVDDVMRAVTARLSSSERNSSRRPAKWSAAAAAVGRRKDAAEAAATASSQLLTAAKQPLSSAAAFGSSSGTGGTAAGHGDGTEDSADGLVTSALRDQNLLLSEIRCACLGPGGEWIAYALLHGDVRLHRGDSGRLLHTFITTPPSMGDLIEAAMQYQHLFTSIADTPALPPMPSSPGKVIIRDAAAAASALSPGVGKTCGGGGGSAIGSATTVVRLAQSPRAQVSPAVYAKAVALVLQQLLTSTTCATDGSARAAPASGMSADADTRVSRNVHREPLHMLYLDASQELLVAYADGLLRSFTVLGHSSTAARVIVSRTLMNRALMQVRRVLASRDRHANAARPSTTTATGLPQGRSPAMLEKLSAAPPQEPLITRVRNDGGLAGAEASEDSRCSAAALGNVRPLSRVARRGGDGVAGRLSTSHAAEAMSAAPAAPPLPAATPVDAVRAVMVSLSTRQFEPDVVLLATASPPLGLVCLVHASGLVTVLDVQAHSDNCGAVWMRMMSDNSDIVSGEASGGGAGEQMAGGRGRAHAGVVVHSFMTADEVTAATFLGAYPCLVLADRQRMLSFHLMKGASLLALLGQFAEELAKDAAACAAGLREQAEAEKHRSAAAGRLLVGARSTASNASTASSPWLPPSSVEAEKGAEQGISSTAASATLVWSVFIDDTCASRRSLGNVTALTFDALYATVYVGTSQGYVVSYLVRRFLSAFQLTPVFLQGVSGVAASTYAAELQRALVTARPAALPCNAESSDFLRNYLRVVFDVPPTVAALVKGACVRGVRRCYAASSGSPPTSATAPSPSPEELDGLVGVYKGCRELFHTAWRDFNGKRRSGVNSYTCAAEPSQAIRICTSGEAFVAAAVLHDAVTRMMAVASVRTTTTETCSGASETPDETRPWWCTPAGRTVQEYVARRCGGSAAQSGMAERSGAAITSAARLGLSSDVDASSTDPDELSMGAEGVQLLRGWVAAALSEQRRCQHLHATTTEAASDGRRLPHDAFFTPLRGTRGGMSTDSSQSSFSSSGFTAVPLLPRSGDSTDAIAGGASSSAALGGAATTASAAATVQQIAEALVQEVQEELLLGAEAPAAISAAGISAVSSALTIPATTSPHPITDAWVECLFTRQAMCTTSRSPLSLLTPPAILERARRERQDRRGRMAATAAAAAGSTGGRGLTVPEWDSYVEGALPDYLADILRHPGQVLTEVERQALQQRSIATLQCRRNGYLCVGHADGSVTLWTPYACARLESLCPKTSLAATLDRLAVSIKAQFRHLYERVLLERQRHAFNGSMRDSGATEEEGASHMKRRIRAMLLEHHLAQLQSEGTGDDGEREEDADTLGGRGHDTESQPMLSTLGTAALNPYKVTTSQGRRQNGHTASPAKVQHAETSGTSTQPFFCGSMEAELLTMRPLLCLLLGVSSPAELRARQLSLEDLFFLPFQLRSLVSLEAFDPHCYDVAVSVAMRRLRRELVEEADEIATEEPAGARQAMPDALTAAVAQTVLSMSPGTSPYSQFSLSGSPRGVRALLDRRRGSAGHQRRARLESVYSYCLSSLARAWRGGADQLQSSRSRGASGAAAFPGALRLLLHRAMEGAPKLQNDAASADSSLSGAPAAQTSMRASEQGAAATVSTGFTEAKHGTAAPAAVGQSPSPTHAAMTDGAAPADGEYYHVCHALQVAEVQAEWAWEFEELSRAWGRLQASAVAAAALSAPARRHQGHERAGAVEGPPAQLPLGSAAAVSSAVNRQVRRGLEAHIAALSHRAVAAALLRNVQLCFRPAPTRAASASPHCRRGDEAGGAYSASLPAASRRGGGLAWVQSVLHQQAQQAFTEPLLTWQQPIQPLFSASLPNPVTSLTRHGAMVTYAPQPGPAPLTAASLVPIGEESLPSSSAGALPHLHSSASSAASGGGPRVVPAECLEGVKTMVFLTEVPGDAADASVSAAADGAGGPSSLAQERAALDASGDTTLMGISGMSGRECFPPPRLPSAADLLPSCDVDAALALRDILSPLPLPPSVRRCVSASGGHRLNPSGVRGALGPTDCGHPITSAMPDTVSLMSPSVSIASSLVMASTPTNGTLGSRSVYPMQRVGQHRRNLVALRRVKLARTGSGGNAPHRRRPPTAGVTAGKGDECIGTAITATLPAAAALTASPLAMCVDFGGGLDGGGVGESRSNRTAGMKAFAYYSLLGQAGTTK
ncbi:hypothetical protein GH5_06513 [Leishmania sp. Ghana 2012 LV757]|uniref:hypothetical protein n=1 Tax=Leishmania sp. Ghana 2012 LV757 TaxID=2803181 RepID=UPI001B4CF3AB|nr:hypothetical protein GH5_06513 [Leishmania sp. Ghana 2012 LV757]